MLWGEVGFPRHTDLGCWIAVHWNSMWTYRDIEAPSESQCNNDQEPRRTETKSKHGFWIFKNDSKFCAGAEKDKLNLQCAYFQVRLGCRGRSSWIVFSVSGWYREGIFCEIPYWWYEPPNFGRAQNPGLRKPLHVYTRGKLGPWLYFRACLGGPTMSCDFPR